MYTGQSDSQSSQEVSTWKKRSRRRPDRCYLISSQFDYEETISSAYGPDYAKHMRWDVAELDEAEVAAQEYPVVLVDTRFDEEECGHLRTIVRQNRGTLFGFSVIDPYAWVRNKPHVEMWFDMKNEPNVFFLSRYQPKEVTKDLFDGVGAKKSVIIPYAFVEPVLPMGGFGERKWKLLHSGRLHKNRYPSRQTIFRIHKWIYPFRSYIKPLSHPGYPDIGEGLDHEVVGDEYVRFLSKYVFMFVSPSRLRLEFQKFRECAMAGCVPVGIPPDGFHDEMRRPLVEREFGSFPKAVMSLPFIFGMSREEAKDRAETYREAYRRHRNPQVLNEKLDAFLEETGLL